MTRFTRSQIKSNPQDQGNQLHQDDSVHQHSDTTASRAAHSTTSTYPPQLGPFHSPSSTSSPSSFPPYLHYAQQQQQQQAPQINVGGSPEANAPPPSTSSRRKSTGSGGGNRKGNPPERRAQHNAIERARRETLNARFLELATMLPATSDVKRPSKSLIVNKSLAFVEDALSREDTYRSQILDLGNQNDSLLVQLNKLRKDQGLEPIESRSAIQLPTPLSDVAAAKSRASSFGKGSGGVVGGTVGEMEDGDDVSGDGGSNYSPNQGQTGLPSQPVMNEHFHHQYGFAPAPTSSHQPAPRYYEHPIAPHHHQSSGGYYHQQPGLSMPQQNQYPSQQGNVQQQGQGQYQTDRQQMQNYDNHTQPHSQNGHQQQQSQHFESAMDDLEGNLSMASSPASNSMPHQYDNENSNQQQRQLENENDDENTYSSSSNFSFTSNNFSSNFNNEFASFGGINFGGFNVMLEA